MKTLNQLFNYPRWIHSLFPIWYIRKPNLRFDGQTWFPWIIFHKNEPISEGIKTHELIHQYQMLDFVLVAAGLFLVDYFEWYVVSLWVVIASLFGQPILHLVNYLVLLLFISRKLDYSYRNTAFEREAYSHQHNTLYLKYRIPFNWVRYFFSKRKGGAK